MIRLVRASLGERVCFVRGDMESLPYADGAFDVVVTCWTLYFMRDIDHALAEIRRVLRPGGRAVVATVAPDHMQEYDALSREVTREVGLKDEIVDVGQRFDLDTGRPYIERAFPGMETREWRGEMALPDVGTLVRFWETHHQSWSVGDAAERARAAVQRRGRGVVGADGKIHIGRHDGLFLGRKR